jgi:hypothetical protein
MRKEGTQNLQNPQSTQIPIYFCELCEFRELCALFS